MSLYKRGISWEPGNALYVSRGPEFLRGESEPVSDRLCGRSCDYASERWDLFAERAAAWTVCAGFVAAHTSSDCELWTAVADDVWPVHRFGAQPGSECRAGDDAGVADSVDHVGAA